MKIKSMQNHSINRGNGIIFAAKQEKKKATGIPLKHALYVMVKIISDIADNN